MFSDLIKKEEKEFYRIKKSFEKINSYKITDISKKDLIALLNNDFDLETLARKSKELTDYFFGKAIMLYIPLYISDYCINGCLYCGFSALNKIERKKLCLKEIEKELISIKEKGFDSVLILTGEDHINSSFDYILKAVKQARKYFSEVLIEVYPLEETQYAKLVDNGLTGVTLYQETYDSKLYDRIHLFGPKKNYNYRLNAVERAIKAKVKEVNTGVLLGINKNWDFDIYMTLIHSKYLLERYPEVEISISYPRIRESFSKVETYPVSDNDFVKIILITRLFIPRVGINISTRENRIMRDNLIGIGITKMSAGSKTTVGGYIAKTNEEKQFEISDKRSVDEVVEVIKRKGYRPEFTNWVKI